ncbi:MAG: hypothetical protein ABIS69_01190 [Sediminibacterium sp.]
MKNFLFGKSLPALIAFTMVICSSYTLSAQRTSFSGDWKLDESKSELGEFGGRIARSVKAEQKDDAITVTRTTPGFNGGDPVTTSVSLPFDGKVVESEGFGGSKRKSTAKWSEDGKTLMINSTMNFERDGESFEFKSTESWTIISDGLLSIAATTNSPRGESATKAIYKK